MWMTMASFLACFKAVSYTHLIWADLEQIRTQYALPTAYRMFLEDLQ